MKNFLILAITIVWVIYFVAVLIMGIGLDAAGSPPSLSPAISDILVPIIFFTGIITLGFLVKYAYFDFMLFKRISKKILKVNLWLLGVSVILLIGNALAAGEILSVSTTHVINKIVEVLIFPLAPYFLLLAPLNYALLSLSGSW